MQCCRLLRQRHQVTTQQQQWTSNRFEPGFKHMSAGAADSRDVHSWLEAGTCLQQGDE